MEHSPLKCVTALRVRRCPKTNSTRFSSLFHLLTLLTPIHFTRNGNGMRVPLNLANPIYRICKGKIYIKLKLWKGILSSGKIASHIRGGKMGVSGILYNESKQVGSNPVNFFSIKYTGMGQPLNTFLSIFQVYYMTMHLL